MNKSYGPQKESRWLPYVQAYVQAYQQGERLGGLAALPMPPRRENAITSAGQRCGNPPVVVLCSPHPDDEMLTGAFPLRLRREHGARVINLAVTLGSDQSRQAARWLELTAACGVAGFECRPLAMPSSFDLKAGEHGPGWRMVVETLAGLLAGLSPDLVFLPHGEDHHPAHVATHRLVTAALALFTFPGKNSLVAVETEYWRPMAAPNLLVGLDAHDVAWQLEALSCHRGEIERNPYHLTQPARMMDTVRRGAELVKTRRTARPGFLFGELYRVSRWRQEIGRAHV